MDKKWYQSKTIIFVLLFAAYKIAAVFGYADFVPSADVAEVVDLVVAAILLVLRFVTNKGIKL